MKEDIRIIEEILLNSIPSLQTVLLDGWILRLNRNYTYRANCACPPAETGGDSAGKIKLCEGLFLRNHLPPVFKVTPLLQPDLPRVLLSLHYRKIKTVTVMRCALAGPAADLCPEIICSETPDESWLAASAALTGVTDPELVSVHCQGIRNIAIRSIFAKAENNGTVIACGYGTVEREHVGIYDLHVNPEYRRRGIGTAICGAILNFGKEQDAKCAYLIVHNKNQNAIALYTRMDFSPLYDYHFYEKPGSPYRIVDA